MRSETDSTGKRRWVVNLRSNVLHQLPTSERCNMDQATERAYPKTYPLCGVPFRGKLLRWCRWCFG